MGSLTVLAGLIFMVFMMSVLLADSKKDQGRQRRQKHSDFDDFDNRYDPIDDPSVNWNPETYLKESKLYERQVFYNKGEGCQGLPCQRKMCFYKSGWSNTMKFYPPYMREQERDCYVIDPKICKCFPDEDCVMTDTEKVVDDHGEYDYHCHPKAAEEPPLEEPPTVSNKQIGEL